MSGALASIADARRLLRELFAAALARVQGRVVLADYARCDAGNFVLTLPGQPAVTIPLPVAGRVVVVGAGKAAASLAQGMEACLGQRIDEGLIIVKYGHGEPLDRIRTRQAGHPVPDRNGVAATAELAAMVENLGADDLLFVLLTGGASALLVQPAPGLTLRDKEIVTGLLLRSAASIEEINMVRKRLSAIKGGGLLRAAAPARVMTMLISDIVGGNVAMVGSGPTIPADDLPDAAMRVIEKYGLAGKLPAQIIAQLSSAVAKGGGRATGDKSASYVLADSATALAAAAEAARAGGFVARIVDAAMTGPTHDAARAFAVAIRSAAEGRKPGAAPIVLLAAGETTLTVTGTGRGGRNQEFALVLAREISGIANVAALVAGTDGSDGPTDAAGALVDGGTVDRALACGVDPQKSLDNNDSYRFFDTINDLLVTGPTGTNVMDLVIALVF